MKSDFCCRKTFRPTVMGEMHSKQIQKNFDLGFFYASSRHWQPYLYLVSRGHLSNVWSQSSHWQPRSIQMHPTMNRFHHALFFFNIPENMSNRTLFFFSGMFHLPPSNQPLLPSDVWFSLCCALAIQTRLNSVQPPAFFLSVLSQHIKLC